MKSMKKSMFVTTILMVVLLIVALSTATFAWYTAQSNVGTTETRVYSASATAASLAIDKTNSATSTASSVAITMAPAIAPMIPNIQPTVYVADPETAATTYSAFLAAMKTAPIDNEGNFTANGTDASAAIIATAGGTEQAFFYVINTNGTNSATVNVTVNIDTTGYSLLTAKPNDWVSGYAHYYTRSGAGTDGDPYVYNQLNAVQNWAADTFYVSNSVIASKLRVAVFAADAYVGTWATTAAATHYGTITNHASGNIATSYNATAAGTTQSFATIAALGAVQTKVVAWYDGVALVVDDSSMPSVFTVSFSVA